MAECCSLRLSYTPDRFAAELISIPTSASVPCPQIQNNIGPLINTVVATNKFEREMATLFGGSAGMEDEVR